MRPEWNGKTVVCIASGPSLTLEDCDMVRRTGHPVVVTNSIFQLCPWADALFVHDTRWWRRYHQDVKTVFQGRRFGASQVSKNYGAETTFGASWFRPFQNSGAGAISLAISGGAAKIVLIGYDACLGPRGEKHVHGDHPAGMPNADTMAAWPRIFAQVAKFAKARGVTVVNASTRTALTCFPRGALVDEL